MRFFADSLHKMMDAHYVVVEVGTIASTRGEFIAMTREEIASATDYRTVTYSSIGIRARAMRPGATWWDMQYVNTPQKKREALANRDAYLKGGR